MSKPIFLHEKKATNVVDGKRVTEEEFLIHGDKGIFIKYFSQDGDKKMKVMAKGNGGKFTMSISHGSEKGKEVELSMEELIKELGKHKFMSFATDYLKKSKKMMSRSRGRSRSRKLSRKSKSKKSRK